MIATYRLQLLPDFNFSDVEQLIPYFKQLGVSHLYLSPVTSSRRGSTHGYDVIDHNEIREELGGRAAFDRLLTVAIDAGLKLILDFVPNHAGVGPRNVYWQDVLAYGSYSPYAGFFDVDWTPIKPELSGKILLPFLGSTYGDTLDKNEISIEYLDGRFYAVYYENRFALSPASYDLILSSLLPRFERTESYWTIKDVLDAYDNLSRSERDKAEALRPRLVMLDEQVHFKDLVGNLQGPELHEILEQQSWRLSYWKTAGYEINYRRFFDINGLVGLRMEDPQVFWEAHRLLGELLTHPGIEGVRIDHIDGLYDPHHYLKTLRDLGARHVWVEKILAPGEVLPEHWPVEGTSGYEYLNDVMGVLVYREGELPLDRIYRRFVGDTRSYDDLVFESKVQVMTTSLSSELFRLAYELDRISEADYHTRDFTLEALREALTNIVASFDRYRTYLPYETEEAKEVIQLAAYRALQRLRIAEPTIYQFLVKVLMGEVREDLKEFQRRWTGRFQQYTAPVAAKGVEDTAFYRYVRLVALNEVGGEPSRFGQSRKAFHSRNRFRALKYPNNLLATATHDHKRGEDTRMRLIVLAEETELWEETITALNRIGEEFQSEQGPTSADRYLLFQILAALWKGTGRNELEERLVPYMIKAIRESKTRTSWTNPDEAYEKAVEGYVRKLVQHERTDEIVEPLASTMARFGFFNSLSQLFLKFTSPGVPDIYQGSELPDLSLVDPDNRRPVDYEQRNRILNDVTRLLEQPDIESLRSKIKLQDESVKLFFTAMLLRFRGQYKELIQGTYRPLDVEGEGQAHWITYLREQGSKAALVAVPRFPSTWSNQAEAHVRLPDDLAGTTWTNVLDQSPLPVETHVDLTRFPLPWTILVSA